MKDDYTNTGVAEPPVEVEDDERAARQAGRAASRNGHERGAAVEEHEMPGPPKSVLREYFESAVVTVIMALFGMAFIVQAVKVPTGSMQNTINIGDHLLVNKFIFGPGPALPFLPQREIRRGDIIVFKYPGNIHDPEGDKKPENIPFKTNYVKRVIGLPGDRVELRGDRLFINDKLLPEQIIEGRNVDDKAPLETPAPIPPRKDGENYAVYYYRETLEAERDGHGQRYDPNFHYAVNGIPAVVPADSYFVMGDNRDNSSDGRAWGFVHRDLIIGRALFVYWSYDESAPASGNFLADFFRNTRWNRTGTMIK
ncbi:MAG: signal peptidase [Blastocatellia bacterium]|nr:signal peptidase [Blastocatellia bacterium]